MIRKATCTSLFGLSLVLCLPLATRGADAMLTVLDPSQLRAATEAHSGEAALVFTESHEYAIRRIDGIPARWVEQLKGPPSFSGSAQPGQFFVFQVGVYALKETGPLEVRFEDLTGPEGPLPAGSFRCLSLGGTNHLGHPFTRAITVRPGALQALWIGVNVPATARGSYHGALQVRVAPSTTIPVQLQLNVTGPILADHGDSVAKNLSRLRWLDSTAGTEDVLTAPFTAVRTRGRTIQVLGRELELAKDGLPAQIRSFFSAANTAVGKSSREVLAAPMRFAVETDAGPFRWKSRFNRLAHGNSEATWSAVNAGDGLRAEVSGRLDYTGSGEVRVRLIAERDIALRDARLEAPYREEAAKWFMGLGHQGGKRPEEVKWHWDTKKRQDCFWLGDVNAGLMLRFKDAEYLRPPVNIYYAFRPLRLPASWGNEGKGSVEISAEPGQAVVVRAGSGPRRMRQGETLDFIFELYLTPFRTLDTEKQWAVRFIHPVPNHAPATVDNALDSCDPARGPNVLNVHQANYYSPYINYPYSDDSFPALCDLVKRAHAKGVKVRGYYTTREITQNMPELFALHSLNGEVILPGPGKDARTLINPNGPHPWLVENLREQFIPAWVDRVGGKYAELDLSVITTPDSRWNNFYVEGLRWLLEKSDLDGVYIDDTALDAVSMRRARRLLDRRPGRLADLHTWNHFNSYAGFANNLTIYMEILPYLDRLWLGEGFNADAVPADFWLVEMSGLPFGLMSEMLDGTNPWRGMVFGETGRLGWSGDPRGLWKVWDEYGIQGTEFLPYFLNNCPVKTGNPEVRASVFRKPGRSFVALGSWAGGSTSVRLAIDWKALGLKPAQSKIYAPAIAGMQSENVWAPDESIPVSPKRGWFLVIDEVPRQVARAADEVSSMVELLRENFTSPALGADWKLAASTRPGTAVKVSESALRLTATAHSHAGIERTLPPGVRAVEADIQPGTDSGQSWGPGVAFIWPNGKAAKLNLRLEDMRCGLYSDGAFEIASPALSRAERVTVRILLAPDTVYFYQRPAGGSWQEIGRLPRGGLTGNPVTLRIGKHGVDGAWQDYGAPGAPGESAIHGVRVLGN